MLTSPPTTRSTDLTSVGAVLPGHILLLEDDPSIRDVVVTTVLEDEGYVVTARRNRWRPRGCLIG